MEILEDNPTQPESDSDEEEDGGQDNVSVAESADDSEPEADEEDGSDEDDDSDVEESPEDEPQVETAPDGDESDDDESAGVSGPSERIGHPNWEARVNFLRMFQRGKFLSINRHTIEQIVQQEWIVAEVGRRTD